jgi:hypothetical protein
MIENTHDLGVLVTSIISLDSLHLIKLRLNSSLFFLYEKVRSGRDLTTEPVPARRPHLFGCSLSGLVGGLMGRLARQRRAFRPTAGAAPAAVSLSRFAKGAIPPPLQGKGILPTRTSRARRELS